MSCEDNVNHLNGSSVEENLQRQIDTLVRRVDGLETERPGMKGEEARPAEGSTGTGTEGLDHVAGKLECRYAAPFVANFVKVDASHNGVPIIYAFRLEGSSDNVHWELLCRREYKCTEEGLIQFVNAKPFQYYRLLYSKIGEECLSASQFGLYSKWAESTPKAVMTGSFVEGIPLLTRNLHFAYTVTSSSVWEPDPVSHNCYNAFNRATEPPWCSKQNEKESWIMVELPQPRIFNCVCITARGYEKGAAETPRYFSIQGSVDGHTWDVLMRQDVETFSVYRAGERRSFPFANETAYKYYKLYATEHFGPTWGGGANINGCGRLDFGNCAEKHDPTS